MPDPPHLGGETGAGMNDLLEDPSEHHFESYYTGRLCPVNTTEDTLGK